MKRSIFSGCLFLASISVSATPAQSINLLKNKIEQQVLNELSAYTDGKTHVSAGTIDPRLNLKACADDKLSVINPYQTPILNTSTIAVKCLEEDNHWTLYVPVKITILKTILVAKNTLIKGKQVTLDDIYEMEMDTQKLKQGYFTDKKELTGLICKHDIPVDNPFNPYNIELPRLVHKGEQITIIASQDNLTISVDGIALNEGVLGDTVKVKNLSSKRILEAQVTGKKNVTIIL